MGIRPHIPDDRYRSYFLGKYRTPRRDVLYGKPQGLASLSVAASTPTTAQEPRLSDRQQGSRNKNPLSHFVTAPPKWEPRKQIYAFFFLRSSIHLMMTGKKTRLTRVTMTIPIEAMIPIDCRPLCLARATLPKPTRVVSDE